MTETTTKNRLSGLTSQLPVDRLKQEASSFGKALGEKGLSKAGDRVESATTRLSDYASGSVTGKAAKNVAQGDSKLKAGVKATASKVKDTVKDKLGGSSNSGGKLKVTNIVESIDVPVPRDVAYKQWTLFEDFPTFMKKVENVKQEEDQKLTWKAQIFWSHRSWTAEITEQVPNERIVWKSDGEKGHVDGAVTFHELAPDLTRVLVVLEYHPKGLFEHTGNIWRAQGRRARLELKHFRRHVATQTLLHQDEIEGWSGEIRDGEVQESQGEDQKSKDSKDEAPQGSSDDKGGSKSSKSSRSGSKSTSGSRSRSKSSSRPSSSSSRRSQSGSSSSKKAAAGRSSGGS